MDAWFIFFKPISDQWYRCYFDLIIENSDNFSFLSEARNAPFIVVDKPQLKITSSIKHKNMNS